MAALPPVGKGYTPAQWEAWVKANSNAKAPAYTGTAKTDLGTALHGLTWDKVYAALYAAGQKKKPPQSADEVGLETQVLAATEGVAIGVQAGATGSANAVEESGNAAAATNFAPWATGLGNILGALTSATLWIRVAKVVVGGALLIIGVAHMTGASNAVAQAARKAPLPI